MTTYVDDDLISSRIKWKNVDRIEVSYYDISDIASAWQFWVDRCSIVNAKNKELFLEASDVARVKGMVPPIHHLIWKNC